MIAMNRKDWYRDVDIGVFVVDMVERSVDISMLDVE